MFLQLTDFFTILVCFVRMILHFLHFEPSVFPSFQYVAFTPLIF